MIYYSLQKIYANKVLNEGNNVPETVEPEDENSKVLSILSTSLRDIVNIIDQPTEDIESLLGEIREKALSALIDSGIEKD